MYYDHNYNPLPNYTEIEWPTTCGMGSLAKYSQIISTFSKVIPNNKNCLIFKHKSIMHREPMPDYIDYIIVSNSDHIASIDIDSSYFNRPAIILNYDFNLEHYYPFLLVLSSYMMTLQKDVNIHSSRKYRASYIYGKIRIPRIYALVELSKKPYYNELDITMLNHKARHKNLHEVMTNEDGLSVDDVADIFDEYTVLQDKLRPGYDDTSEWDLINKLGNGFDDSYLNIVAEGRIADVGMLTEKIYKPIRAGQLFLVQSAPNSIKFLRSMGFDVFDDYIDHDRYDGELDWKKRTQLMLTVLDDIYDRIEDIFFATTERRRKNQLWLQNPELHNLCLQGVVAQL